MAKILSNFPIKSAKEIELDEQLKDEARKFLEKYGLLSFLDVCQGSLSNILVKKGIITSGELRDEYLLGISKAQDNFKNKIK
jgi:hypothetical protein